MITVYVWSEIYVPHHSWGHASLEVDEIYISWWPTKAKSKHNLKKKKIDGHSHDQLPKNYEDDKRNFMGRAANHIFHIPSDKVNPSKIKEWWRQKEKDGYHFLFNNCCDIVVHALREGGARLKYEPIRQPCDVVSDCQILTGENLCTLL